MIAAYAVQAHVCYIYIRGEYFIDGEKLQAAIDEAYEKNLILEPETDGLQSFITVKSLAHNLYWEFYWF